MNIVKYHIYLMDGEISSLLVELNADILDYWHRNVERDRRYEYALAAVNDEGREGARSHISVE
jgi:hypothetical protein